MVGWFTFHVITMTLILMKILVVNLVSKFETNPDFDLEDLEKKQKMHLLPIAVTNVPI